MLRVTKDAQGVYRYHHGIETKGKFQQTYGYFETRAKFTREPGWWGAVWLNGVNKGINPFLFGQEIDIYLFTNGRIRGEADRSPASFMLQGTRLHDGENVLIAMAESDAGLIGLSQPRSLTVSEAQKK